MNIVIVDDNLHTTNTIKEMLLLEFNNAKVNSYNKILKIEREELMTADFLLMDYNLEDSMNGVQLAERLINLGYSGTIIFITGESNLIVKTKLRFSGVKGYFYLNKNDDLIENILRIIKENQSNESK